MMRAVKIIALVVGALVLILSGAVIWVINDEALIARQIERYLSKSTGRTLTIGDLNLHIGRRTQVHMTEVHLENADWGAAADLLSLDDLQASVDLSGVLKGEVLVESMILNGVRIHLEEIGSGEVNWDIFPDAEKDTKGEEQAHVPFLRLQLTDFELTHESPSRRVPLDFRISQLTATHPPGGRVDLTAEGVIGSLPLSVNGFVNPARALVEGGSLDHQLEINLGQVSLTSEGNIQDVRSVAGAKLDLRFSGPEMEWLLQRAALPEFSTGPFDAALKLDVTEQGFVKVDLDGDFGTLNAKADGELDRIVDPSHFDIRFELAGHDLRALGETFGAENLPGLDFHVSGKSVLHNSALQLPQLLAVAGSTRLTASGTIGPWPRLQGTSLDITASGQDIRDWGPAMGFERWQASAFEIEGRFAEQDGGVAFGGSSIQLGQTRFEFYGTLGSLPGFTGGQVSLRFETPDIGAVLDWPRLASWTGTPVAVEGQISRAPQGLELKGVRTSIGDARVDLDGILALQEAPGTSAERPWHAWLTGSDLTAQIDLPDVGKLARTFDITWLPEQGLSASIRARLGPEGLMLEASKGRLGSIAWKFDAAFPQVTSARGANLTFTAETERLSNLEIFAPKVEWPDQPARLDGSVRPMDEGLVFDDVRARVGGVTIEANGDFAFSPDFRLRQLQFSASGPEFHPFFKDIRLQSLPQRFHIGAEVAGGEDRDALRSFVLRIGDAELKANGILDNFFEPASADLDIELTVPEPQQFEAFFGHFGGIPLPEMPLEAEFSASRDARGIRFRGIEAALGPGDLAGELEIRLNKVPEYRGAFTAKYLDLSWLPDPVEDRSFQKSRMDMTNKDAAGSRGTAPSRMFSDDPLPILSIDPVVIDLSLQAGDLDLPNQKLTDVNIGFAMTEDELRLMPFDVTDPGQGRLSGTVLLRDEQGSLRAEVDGAVRGFRFGIAAVENQDPATYPPWDVAVKLNTSGKSMHELAVSAIGNLEVIVGKGKIANTRIDLFFSDVFSELMTTLNPFRKENPYTNMDCTVMVVEFVDGQAAIDPLIIQTDRMVIASKGTVSLETEKIDLSFNSRPRKGIGISPGMVITPLISLGGTLARPSINLNPSGAAISSGAAVVTSGLSLLGKSLYDRFLSERDPCGKIAADLRKMEENDAGEAN